MGVAVGHPARTTDGVSIGGRAGQRNTTGTGNTLLGNKAGYGNGAFSKAVAIGANALENATASNNTAIGYSAGQAVITGSANVFVGYSAGSAETGSNKLYIENSNSATPLIYGEFDTDLVRVNGKLEVKNENFVIGTANSVAGSGNNNFNGTFEFANGPGTYQSQLIFRPTGNAGGYNNNYWGSIGWDPGSGLKLNAANYTDNIWFTKGIPESANPLAYGKLNGTGLKLGNNYSNSFGTATERLDVVGNIKASGSITVDQVSSTTNLFTKTANTDHSAQGDIVKFGTATATTQGDLYYFNASGGWTQASADATVSSGGVLLAIALGTASATNGMLLRGIYTMDAAAIDGTEATGDELYVGVTAGHVTNTAPGSGDIVRVVGYCLDGTNGQIWFNPSNDFILVA